MNAIFPTSETALCDGDLLDAWTGDQHGPALAELVHRYSWMVLSVCRRRCRSEADADDAYQTTFLYLARNAGKIRKPERLPGWLHRVAQRAATATLHNKHSQVEPMVEPPAIPDDPLQRLTQRHEAIVLDEELADLPADYRAAIVLHLYEGLTIQTLADRFETTTGSIRGKLQRGKKLLALRLRQRGVVPIVAFASANTWSVTDAQAATACESLSSAISETGLPDPPIDSSLLDSLRAQGATAMPTITSATAIIGGTALVAALMMVTGTQGQRQDDRRTEKQVVSLPPVSVDSDARFQLGALGSAKSTSPRSSSPKPSGPSMVWERRAETPEPDSVVAKNIQAALDQPTEGPLNLEALQNKPGLPVFIDNRAIAEADVDLDSQVIEFDGPEMPLRSALRKMLQPHGLKAEVENDGLIITADFEELSHQGFPMSRWIDSDQDKREAFEKVLDQETTLKFDDAPLNEVARTLSETHSIQMVVDRRALEEIGLSEEEPITIDLKNVSLRSALRMLLREIDLTYIVQDEVFVITTIEKAEQNRLGRIYWLEGTGFASDDLDSAIELIKTMIHPATWDSLGGPSSMQPLNQKRPAIIVSTITDVHEQIEDLLQVCREGHFGQPPVMKNVEVPAPQTVGGGGDGRGGGGRGGGGRGGGFDGIGGSN